MAHWPKYSVDSHYDCRLDNLSSTSAALVPQFVGFLSWLLTYLQYLSVVWILLKYRLQLSQKRRKNEALPEDFSADSIFFCWRKIFKKNTQLLQWAQPSEFPPKIPAHHFRETIASNHVVRKSHKSWCMPSTGDQAARRPVMQHIILSSICGRWFGDLRGKLRNVSDLIWHPIFSVYTFRWSPTICVKLKWDSA